MSKLKKFKRAFAACVGAATVLTSVSIGGASVSADDQNYAEALALSLYFFDANECGSGVDDNCLTWRGNCHTYDGTASLDKAEGLSSASKQAIIAQTGNSSTVDVSGGYHDAGDHVKFTMTMGFSTTSLAWSYFSYPDSYKKAGCEDHLMYILRKMCDYMMKVTYLDGSDNVICFCYQVANGDTDHNVTWESPEKQTYERVTYWADASHPSGDTSGEMASALASASLAFRGKDDAYADKCLKYAKALSSFTKQHTAATYDGVGSFYASGSQKDDLAWADIWCTLAENGGKLPSGYTPPCEPLDGRANYTNGENDYWIYSWDKVYGGIATLLHEVGYKTSTCESEISFELNNNGGVNAGTYNTKGWGSSRYNCALQRYALELAAGNADSSYAKGAKWQMDYILGSNQKSTSFLIGYGSTNPSQLHHRAANCNKTGATHVLYGALVGGPTDSNCTYTDYWDQYQSTEPALDYNGCFALACAGLADLYGGDASAAKTVIANAPEINENFVFGSSSTDPTEPVTEPTEQPTEPVTDPNPKPDYVYDINQDSVINVSDIVCLQRFLTKQYEEVHISTNEPVPPGSLTDFIKIGEWQIPFGLTSGNGAYYYTFGGVSDFDVNRDGKVNIFDDIALKRMILSLEGNSTTLVD